MPNRRLLFLLGSVLVAASAIAQPPLLLDPSQAPITLKGGWQLPHGPAGQVGLSGEIRVKISKINPDGTFEGKLDFFTPQRTWCNAVDEPIKEGRITPNGLTVVANGGARAVCGLMTLEFRRGKDKYLQGRVKSEAQPYGAPMWLDAPK